MKNGAKNGHDANGRFTNGNAGGKRGRSGRRPDKIKTLADEVTDRYQLIPMLAQLAANANERASDRINAARVVLEYTHQKPTQTVEHTGEVLNVHEHRQTFESRMDRLTQRLGAAAFPEFPE